MQSLRPSRRLYSVEERLRGQAVCARQAGTGEGPSSSNVADLEITCRLGSVRAGTNPALGLAEGTCARA